MRNSTKRFALLLCAFVFAAYAVIGQENKQELTPAEKKTAHDIADRFIQLLDETGDIEPVIKEMFVSDFVARYVKEKKRERLRERLEEKVVSKQIFYAPGLNYDGVLLDQATEEDWRNFYVTTFNFMQYGYGVTLNTIAKSIINNGQADDEELDKAIDRMYPKSVLKLFDADPILRNVYRKTDDDPEIIKSIDDLRRINKTLAEATKILRERDNASRMKMTSDAKKVVSLMKQKMTDKQLLNLYIGDSGFYGFPKHTRFISIFATAAHNLLITKIDGEYKILSARHSSVD